VAGPPTVALLLEDRSIDDKDRRPRSQFQRRPNIYDAVQPVRQLLVLRRAIAEVLAPLFEITKELLDAPRGREPDEDAARSGTVIDKRVRNASRSEDRIAWAQPKPLIADLDDVFSGRGNRTTRLALRGSA
jgi:hypothetical protein